MIEENKTWGSKTGGGAIYTSNAETIRCRSMGALWSLET